MKNKSPRQIFKKYLKNKKCRNCENKATGLFNKIPYCKEHFTIQKLKARGIDPQSQIKDK